MTRSTDLVSTTPPGGHRGFKRASCLLGAVLACPSLMAGTTGASAAGASGQVLSWGAYPLGDGLSSGFGPTPVAVALPPDTVFTAVAVGAQHSLALTSAGQVWVWNSGNNTPVPVGLPAGTLVSRIAAHEDQSLALTTEGQVLAWGNGSGGVTVVPMPGGARVTAIAAGNGFDLALTASGQVLAWGTDGEGELGDGGGGLVRSSVLGPVSPLLPSGTVVTAIAAGDSHSLALTSTGQVYTWGYNGDGELGRATTGQTGPTPMPVGGLPTGKTVSTIAAGSVYSLVATTDGQVFGWGYDTDGELGDVGGGPLGGCFCRPEPVAAALPAGTIVTDVVGGDNHSLAITASGQLLAWGANGVGALGYPTTPVAGAPAYMIPNPVPTPVNLPPGTVVSSAAAGGDWRQSHSPGGDLYSRSLAVTGPRPLLTSRFRGDASAVFLQGVTMLPGSSPAQRTEGGLGVCEAAVSDSTPPGSSPTTTRGTGSAACGGVDLSQGACGAPPPTPEAALPCRGVGCCGVLAESNPITVSPPGGNPPLLVAAVNDESVTISGTFNAGSSRAHSQVSWISLLPGTVPSGTSTSAVLEARLLETSSSASCANGAPGAAAGTSSIGRVTIAGTTIATQPVGSRIILNPTGRNAVTLYGNPISINPTGGRIPLAVVTLNYTRYDLATNTRVASPLVVDFPAGGPLSSLIVGRVFLSFARTGLSGCHA